MDFTTELALGASVTLLCFLVFSGIIIIRQRRRRRRSIHWFAVLLLSALVGVFASLTLRLTGSGPIGDPSEIGSSVDLNQGLYED